MSWPVCCKHCLQHGLQRRLADNIASVCRDPQCQNGGILNAKNTSDTLHCATCSCPDGWRGADCSLCERVDVCPSRQGDKGALLGPGSTPGLTHPVRELFLRHQALTGPDSTARGWPHSCMSDKQMLSAIFQCTRHRQGCYAQGGDITSGNAVPGVGPLHDFRQTGLGHCVLESRQVTGTLTDRAHSVAEDNSCQTLN